MHVKQMLHELRSTIADARAHGDIPGHLRAWLKTVTTPDDKTISPGLSVTVHGIRGHVLYPTTIPGYWAIAVSG